MRAEPVISSVSSIGFTVLMPTSASSASASWCRPRGYGYRRHIDLNLSNVRFGSEADITADHRVVRFVPIAGMMPPRIMQEGAPLTQSTALRLDEGPLGKALWEPLDRVDVKEVPLSSPRSEV